MSEFIREENEEIVEREPFVVDDDQKAEWCLKQIRQKQEELAMWKEHYERLFDNVRRTIEGDIVWFEGSLKGYFLQQEDAGFTKTTKTQTSYSLPHGKLVLKKQEPEYERDEDTMLKWLDQNMPEFVKVKKTVDWSGLKKTLITDGETMMTEDGEIVPGVTVTRRPDIFKVEVK